MKELMADLNANKILKIILRYACIVLCFYGIGLFKHYRVEGAIDPLYFTGESRIIYLTFILLGGLLYFLLEIKRGANPNN
jgi:hypothetical protein